LDITFNENPDAWWGKTAKANADKDVAGLMLAVYRGGYEDSKIQQQQQYYVVQQS